VILRFIILVVLFIGSIAFGALYIGRNRRVLGEAVRKRRPRKFEPVTLDRSPEEPHVPGATS
jgi:hypothetical protein